MEGLATAEQSVPIQGQPQPVQQPQGSEPPPTTIVPSATVDTQQPRTEWDILRDHLRQDPHDADSWTKLVDLAEESGNYERTKETYEVLLEQYPNTSSAQIAYISFVLESSHSDKFQHAVTLFNRFLKTSPFIDLWKFYLSYVKRMNQGPNVRDTVRKAYEYALNHIGHDKESTEIWTEYIQLLKSVEPANPWDEGQKMDAIRKAYQRAVQTPMDGVKRLWEEYQEFENNLNKITAKKFISDLQAAHMQARTVLNQLQEHSMVLFPPVPPSKTGRPAIWLPRTPTFNANDKALVGRWRMYLKWEESNPLEIEEKDKSQLHSRLQSVYRKAIVRMRYFSEVWYMAYVYTIGLSNDQSLPENKRKEKRDEAMSILKAGVEANPSSFVLNFAYAEALEDNKNWEEVHNVFKKFLDVLRQGLENLEAKQLKEQGAVDTSFGSDATQAAETNGAGPNGSQDHSQQSQQTQISQVTTSSQGSGFGKNKDLSERRTEYGIAWIVYMRFARRAESLVAARGVFSKARKDKWTPWEVYEAAALMEYHCFKASDIATRIFEKGLEYFSDEVEFALRYLGFLISINDDANARALFERLITMFPPEKSRPIWERWARYEYQFGNLQAAQNLEKRMTEAFPNDPPIKRFAERHKYLGTDAIAIRDLGFVVGRGAGNGIARSTISSLTRTETQQSLLSPVAGQAIAASQTVVSAAGKRGPSPEARRKGDYEYGPPLKKHRPPSPTPRDRDWERRDHSRRRYASPSWDRDRDHPRGGYREKEEEKAVTLPPVLSWFVGMLPPPAAFDGPVFRTDDLMQVFRNAVIPSSTGIRARSPPRGGVLPPDYGPYQGPGGRGRRY